MVATNDEILAAIQEGNKILKQLVAQDQLKFKKDSSGKNADLEAIKTDLEIIK
jgi:hypothetical protein